MEWTNEYQLYRSETSHMNSLDVENKYSFIKTPRWKGQAMEVGPLARMLVGYALGREDFKEVVDSALTKLDVPAEALFST